MARRGGGGGELAGAAAQALGVAVFAKPFGVAGVLLRSLGGSVADLVDLGGLDFERAISRNLAKAGSSCFQRQRVVRLTLSWVPALESLLPVRRIVSYMVSAISSVRRVGRPGWWAR